MVEGDQRLLRVVLETCYATRGNSSAISLKRVEFGLTEIEGTPMYFVRDNGVDFDMAYAVKLLGAFQRLHRTSEFSGYWYTPGYGTTYRTPARRFGVGGGCGGAGGCALLHALEKLVLADGLVRPCGSSLSPNERDAFILAQASDGAQGFFPYGPSLYTSGVFNRLSTR